MVTIRSRSKNRTYDNNGNLIAWIQERCIKCQRFLTRYQRQFCSLCAKQRSNERHRNWKRKDYKIHPERYKRYTYSNLRRVIQNQREMYSLKTIRKSIDVEIPTYLYATLKGFV